MNYSICYGVLVSALSKCQNPSDTVYVLPPEHVPMHIQKLYRDKYGKGYFYYVTELEAYDDGEYEYGHEFFPCEEIRYTNNIGGNLRNFYATDHVSWLVTDNDIDAINTHIYNVYAPTTATT